MYVVRLAIYRFPSTPIFRDFDETSPDSHIGPYR